MDLEKEVKIMLTVFTLNDFSKTISPIHQDYFKMRFDDMLSEAHSFAARGPERLVGICTPYRYKFPLSARDPR